MVSFNNYDPKIDLNFKLYKSFIVISLIAHRDKP